MKARILEPVEYPKWDRFVNRHPLGTIHQTSQWGKFQNQIHTRGKSWIIVLESEGKIIGGTLLVRHTLPRGLSWLYSSRGPLLKYNSHNLQSKVEAIIQAIKPIAKQEKAIFYRIDPPLSASTPRPKLKKFFISHNGFHPEDTLILELKQPEKDILAQMKPKGRYNIRLAEKKGVQIREANSRKPIDFQRDLETFHSILNETTNRDKFYGHRVSVYKSMLEILAPDSKSSHSPTAKLLIAEYKNQPIAANIITYYNDTAVYYYGASSDHHRNVMAPYLLQWHAITEARRHGYKFYDFLGIAPANAKSHPWLGVTAFKLKFGGTHTTYQPPREFPFKFFHYILFRIYKRFH